MQQENISVTTLCSLSAINWGLLNNTSELENLCDMAVQMLDCLLESSSYLNKLSEVETKSARYLGIGITNFAYFLAKNRVRYQDKDALQLVNIYSEAQMFFLMKASMKLAKEKGACKYFDRTKYSQGILPIDHYNKNVDALITSELLQDWESLRQDILTYGMRNSTLFACMPVQSSSVVSNATNGIEPPRAFLNKIKSKHGLSPQIVPEYSKLKNYYTLMYDKPLTKDYLNICAVIQKYADQAISVNTYYSPAHYTDGKVSQFDVVDNILQHYKLGGKTLYYSNTSDGRDAQEKDVEESVLECFMPSEAILGVSESMDDEVDCGCKL